MSEAKERIMRKGMLAATFAVVSFAGLALAPFVVALKTLPGSLL